MSKSIFELTAENMLASLQAIQVANGYEITPLVRRLGTDKNPEPRNFDPSSNLPYSIEIVIEQGEVESVPPLSYSKQYHYVHFLLMALIQQSEDSDVQTDTLINQIVASVTKALMADPQRGVFPGGSNPLALDTLIDTAQPLAKAEAGCEGVLIPVRVHLQTTQFDPYHQ